MKKQPFSRLKRTISGILALTMTASLTSVMPAAADTPIEPVSRTYSGDGYEVRYDVTGGWADNRNVQVTLTNTGEEPLQNWALKYDVQGEIVNIWNGTVAASGDDWSIVKNNGYNYDIQPKASTSFGYIVSGNDSTLPETIELCTERKEVAEDNYAVKLNIDSDWDSGFTGSFSIENLGDTPIEAWRLSFDNNFVIENTWNADIYSAEGNSYTVANAYATAFINPHEAVSFGFRGTKENDVIPEISNVSLSAVTINADIKTEVTVSDSSESSSEDSSSESSSEITDSNSSEDSSTTDSSSTSDDSSSVPDSQPDDSSETESKPDDSSIPDEEPEDELSDALSIFAYGHYNKEEKAIDIDWYTETKGEYTVLESDDNVDYSEVITVSDFSDYRYHITEPFDTKYFKVKVTSGKKYAESVPFEVKRTADGYDVAFIDTDGDGIADAREDELGTDKNKADTDDDGVSDHDELCLINSDPLVYDSITEGVSDKYADSDEDGLSNYEEIKLGTSPMFDDTDSDGLKDGEEVNTYNTDPFNKDTDKDGLTDYEEVTLGTDPLKASTNGETPDSKITKEQTLGIEAKAFEEVNSIFNPFKVSMDITAAGIAYDNLEAKISGYANAIQSDAVFGSVPEFSYSEGLDVQSATIKFSIDDEYIANTNGKYAEVSDDFAGIKRFSVFKYFEELDMLLPIKTTYDLDSNTVITKVDELGTYCLIDMEVWLESLEVEPEKLETITISGGPISMVGITVNKSLFMASAASAEIDLPENSNKIVDVVFSTFLMKSSKQRVLEQINKAGEILFDKYGSSGNVHIYVTDCFGNISTYGIHEQPYATDLFELEEITSHVGINNSSNRSKLITPVSKFFNNNTLRANADKFFVSVQSAEAECNTADTNEISELFLEKNINASIVTNLPEISVIPDITGGLNYNGNIFMFGEPIAEHIIRFVGLLDEGKVYKTVSSVGLKTIAIEADIESDYEEIAKRGPTEQERQTYADQDEDGLLDLEEIRYDINGHKAVTWNISGEVQLLTIKDCMELEEVRSYTEEAFSQYVGFDISLLNDFKVLPIRTDPTMADSDYDKISDVIELEIGTGPLSEDTDGDKLSDYTEVINYYDPLNRNPDDDNYGDWAEYHYDLDPFSYDMDLVDWHFEFQKGLWLGDFETADTIPALLGQITCGFIPIVSDLGDLRDIIAAATQGEWGSVAVSVAGFLPGLGDAFKASAHISKFIQKYADDVPKIANAISEVVKEATAFVKHLSPEATKSIGKAATKGVNLSKSKATRFERFIKTIGEIFSNPKVQEAKDLAEKVTGVVEKLFGYEPNEDCDCTGDTSQCFVAGTLVMTENGFIPIENIRVGDFVYSKKNNTDEGKYKKVTQTFVNETDELVHIRVSGETISSTPNHPFYVDKLGWRIANSLRAGDVLVLANGALVTVEWVQHEILEIPVKVYNFEVEDYHTYFVSKYEVWVHNNCSAHAATLRKNIEKEGRHFNQGDVAAHIVASGGYQRQWESAAKSRAILNKYGVDIDTAANGVPLASNLHPNTHTRDFNDRVFKRLSDLEKDMISSGYGASAIKTAIMQELRDIGKQVVGGNFNI